VYSGTILESTMYDTIHCINTVQSYLDKRDLCKRDFALNGNLAQKKVHSILIPLDNRDLPNTKRDFPKFSAKVQFFF
jgi:hypothetical protein